MVRLSKVKKNNGKQERIKEGGAEVIERGKENMRGWLRCIGSRYTRGIVQRCFVLWLDVLVHVDALSRLIICAGL